MILQSEMFIWIRFWETSTAIRSRLEDTLSIRSFQDKKKEKGHSQGLTPLVRILIPTITGRKHGQPRRLSVRIGRRNRYRCFFFTKFIRDGIPEFGIGGTKGRTLFLKVQRRSSTIGRALRRMGRVTVFTKRWQHVRTRR